MTLSQFYVSLSFSMSIWIRLNRNQLFIFGEIFSSVFFWSMWICHKLLLLRISVGHIDAVIVAADIIFIGVCNSFDSRSGISIVILPLSVLLRCLLLLPSHLLPAAIVKCLMPDGRTFTYTSDGECAFSNAIHLSLSRRLFFRIDSHWWFLERCFYSGGVK